MLDHAAGLSARRAPHRVRRCRGRGGTVWRSPRAKRAGRGRGAHQPGLHGEVRACRASRTGFRPCRAALRPGARACPPPSQCHRLGTTHRAARAAVLSLSARRQRRRRDHALDDLLPTGGGDPVWPARPLSSRRAPRPCARHHRDPSGDGDGRPARRGEPVASRGWPQPVGRHPAGGRSPPRARPRFPLRHRRRRHRRCDGGSGRRQSGWVLGAGRGARDGVAT